MAAVRQVKSMASTHMSTALISQRMAAGASGPAVRSTFFPPLKKLPKGR